MARRTRDCEAAAPHRLDRSARCEQRGVERRLGADRVAIDPAARVSYEVKKVARVAAEDVVLARGRALDERKALLQDDDALLRFRMLPCRVQVGERAVAYEVDGAPA
jgi:hypothetical protein